MTTYTSRSARVSQSLRRQRYRNYWVDIKTTMDPLNTTLLSESYMLSEVISCLNKPISSPNSLHTANKSSRSIPELPANSSLLATASQVYSLPLQLQHLPGRICAPSLLLTLHGPRSFTGSAISVNTSICEVNCCPSLKISFRMLVYGF
jgi:hypothetical protein